MTNDQRMLSTMTNRPFDPVAGLLQDDEEITPPAAS